MGMGNLPLGVQSQQLLFAVIMWAGEINADNCGNEQIVGNVTVQRSGK
jgi:hypothetical protein